MKKTIRKFAVWLRAKTDEWVVSRELWEAVDREEWDKAEKLLDQARETWPNDPEVMYCGSIIHHFKG